MKVAFRHLGNTMKISAYTTTRNCLEMDYPFVESIESMLAFADEVVIVDTSDGRDATFDHLKAMEAKEKRVVVIDARDRFDWRAPNHGIFDGQTKALSRSSCTGQFLWQFDVDEVVHEVDAPKIRKLIENSKHLQGAPLLALPVVEYWGRNGKVRVDVNPWKARLSRNLPDFTHGIPKPLRRQFNGLDYASPGTDTCDYISKATGMPIPIMGFVPDQIEYLRRGCVSNHKMIETYARWYNSAIDTLPGVFHYSWFNIERKIRQYKLFWTDFWKAMYGPDSSQNKDPNWNPFFEVPWSQVTDEMIVAKAEELETKTGGHIFHSRWNGTSIPHVTIKRNHPQAIQEWVKRHM